MVSPSTLQPKPTSGDLVRWFCSSWRSALYLAFCSLRLCSRRRRPVRAAARGAVVFLRHSIPTQAWWYVTRAAGLMAYLLTWWSTVWGLGLASRIFHPAVEGARRTISMSSFRSWRLAFMLLHVGVLMLDRFLPFSLAQLLIPFISTYRPFWVGLGVHRLVHIHSRHRDVLSAARDRHPGLSQHPRPQSGRLCGRHAARVVRRHGLRAARPPSSCMPARSLAWCSCSSTGS